MSLSLSSRGAPGRPLCGQRRTDAMSRTVFNAPEKVPVTLDRPWRGRYATFTSVIRQPDFDARRTISSGQPKRRSTMPRSSRGCRLAARIGPRSRRRTPWRTRRAEHSATFATRAGTGQDPGRGRRRPSTRSAWPSRTGSATLWRSAPSSDPSQSIKHTSSVRAATRPAKHAAPNPRWGSSMTCAPKRAASSREPSVDPLSTTIGSYPAGNEASTPGSAARSSRTGSITSITGFSLVELGDRP